ncbi:MAG: acylphosphatase [Devosia sp.]
MKAVQVTVTGRVQGVGYRAWTEGEATRLELNGWVRNRRDGSVEALLSGEQSLVDQMVTGMRQGPPSAAVIELRVTPFPGAAGIGFRVLPTA